MFTTDQYEKALSAIRDKMTDREITILRFQYAASDRTITARQLAEVLGYASYSLANLNYGKLGRKLKPHLGASLGYHRDGAVEFWRYISHGRDSEQGYLWIMHPEMASALEKAEIVGIVEAPLLPEEVDTNAAYPEGAVISISVNAYERNPRAREACIRFYGSKCHICRFDFGDTYGPAGTGLIHVHHIKPLSEIRMQYEVDPIEDLRPLCPNCHAMLHHRTPPYSIDEIRAMIHRT